MSKPVRLRIAPHIGATRLQALRGGHLNAMYAQLERDRLSTATIRLAHAVIRGALGDAVRWGLLVRNPAAMADPPKLVGSRASAWTADELRRFLDHVPDDRLFALWRTAATTGMRRGELAGLTWRALDLGAGKPDRRTATGRFRADRRWRSSRARRPPCFKGRLRRVSAS
jgi:integrase